MSYEPKRPAFNWTILLVFVSGALLFLFFITVTAGRSDGESIWKQARRIEIELDQAVTENKDLRATLANADSRLSEVERALGESTERTRILEEDNLRALAIVGNITELSIGLASGSGDIEQLSRELAAEIDIAIDTVRRLQDSLPPDVD